MIAALRTTLALVLAVLACSVLPSATAMATATATGRSAPHCDALDLGDATAVRAKAGDVTDVFAGKVRSAKALMSVGGGAGRAGQEDKPRKPSDWEHTVQVTVGFRTDHKSGDRVVVTSATVADGGLGRLEIGSTYLFFVTTHQGMDHLVAEACSGTQMLRGGLSAQQQSALEAALADDSANPTAAVELSAPGDGTRSSPALGRLAAPGAAVALIGVLGLLLLSRVGARRA
jgi:hypothetical protein